MSAPGSVVQLTDGPHINHPGYFLESSFTEDGGDVLFTSYRTGVPQLFLMRYPDGEPKQLTFGEAIHPYSAAIRGNRVFFSRADEIRELSLDTGVERCIIQYPGASIGEVAPDRTGDWFVADVKTGAQCGLICGQTDGTAISFIPFPRTVIHPQFHPLEPEWIEFAADPAPRMFRVRRDGSGMECLHQHGNEEFVVHETFLGDTGDLVFTIWPHSLCRMDWTTRAISTVSRFNAWHISPNRAGTRILCDTNHPDTGIWSIDAGTGERDLVCLSESSNAGTQWHKSTYALREDFAAAQDGALSWMERPVDTVYGPQWTHPHPAFSFDERRITFTSDKTGTAQVYVAEL